MQFTVTLRVHVCYITVLYETYSYCYIAIQIDHDESSIDPTISCISARISYGKKRQEKKKKYNMTTNRALFCRSLVVAGPSVLLLSLFLSQGDAVSVSRRFAFHPALLARVSRNHLTRNLIRIDSREGERLPHPLRLSIRRAV